MKDALDIAHSHEVIGVHYPSDLEAGHVLARQFVNLARSLRAPWPS